MLSLTFVCFIALPIFTLITYLFYGPGESWQHLQKTILPGYLANSFWLLIGTSILSLLIGVSSAWVVSRYEFTFRKQIEWLLILPLAIPSYITAYAYAGIVDYGGLLEQLFGKTFPKIDVMNLTGLIWVLSLSLYSYVYVSARAFFLYQSGRLLEASKMLGVGEFKSFFKLILPLSRPAIISGLVLVLMEVLNDYGAAKHYGINTFTTGIFRAWFSLEEPETAIYLSALLVSIIFILLLLERWQRRNKNYSLNSKSEYGLTRIRKRNSVSIGIYFIVAIPMFFGFIAPLIQLIQWAFLTYESVFTSSFITTSLQSLGIAFLSALLTVVMALVLLYTSKWNQLAIVKQFSKIGVIGYAIPGAIIAIGVLIPTLEFDKWLASFLKKNYDIKIGLLLNSSIMALLYAYVVRFIAVAYNPIEALTNKQAKSLVESSKLLGKNNLKTFFKVDFPLIKTGVLSAFVLVFVDVMKELPLTLILKPYQVETLAVKAYEYASDEQIMEAALPSIFIIITGIIPIIFLNKLINNAKSN
ncbi:ABC transporter permease [Pseudofulvibacter geojedonensis]|uniref:ABC transporter permease n=1 Tax=Pseudofulvibacter geojedonensis TaxID=1123758 RepID=A0ABW3I2C9_9FLAO